MVSMEHNPEMEQLIELLLIYGLLDKSDNADQDLMDCYGFKRIVWYNLLAPRFRAVL